jgi:hypothetical protein
MFHYRRVFISDSCNHFTRQDPSYGQRLTYAHAGNSKRWILMAPLAFLKEKHKQWISHALPPMFMLHTHTQPGFLKHGMEWNGAPFFRLKVYTSPSTSTMLVTMDSMDHITAGSNPAVRRVACLARKGFK